MADRIPQYNIFPQNITSTLHNQQQVPQQLQQQSQPDSQLVPGLNNTEHGRMWQQQIQNQYRAQNGGDMNPAQQQMMEYMRRSVQGQQQMAQQPQQQFGLASASQRMNPSAPFHDLQNPQNPQTMMQPNFAMMQNSASMPQQMNARNAAMMQALQANQNGNMSRQIQLMSLAQQQNQQKQQQSPNPSMDFAARLAQQQHNQPNANGTVGSSQPNQAELYSSPALQPNTDGVHASPHPASQSLLSQGSMQNQVQQSQPPMQGGTRMSPNDLQERKIYLQNQINQGETALKRIAAVRQPQDPSWIQQMQQIYYEVRNKKEILNRINSAIQMTSQTMSNPVTNVVPGGSSGNMNPMSSSPMQAPQPGAVNGHPQSNWMSPANPNFAMVTTAGPSSSLVSQPLVPNNPNNATPLSAQPGPAQNQIPPRSGHTPQQALGNPQVSAMSPRVNNQFPHQASGQVPGQPRLDGVPPISLVTPMDKTRFEMTYPSFCRSRGIEPNLRIPISDSRSFDLHQLHVHVMREGGHAKVTQRELWPVIGGRLGFVQFQAQDGEPDKAGPGLAHRLQQVYAEYLQPFDMAYIGMFFKRAAPPAAGSSMQPNGPSSSDAQPGPRLAISHPHFVAMAMRFANTPVAEMRQQNCPENFIQFVENARPQLLLRLQQNAIRNGMSKGVPPSIPPEQPGAPPNAAMGRFQESQESHPLTSMPMPPVRVPSAIPNGPPLQATNDGAPLSKSIARPQPPGNTILQRPTQGQLHQAVQFVASMRQQYVNRTQMTQYHVPDEQRMEYNHLLEQMYKATVEFDNKIPMYFVLLNHEHTVRQLVVMVHMVAQQRLLVGTNPPKYIFDLSQLRRMQLQLHHCSENFERAYRALQAGSSSTPHPPGNGAPPPQPPNPPQAIVIQQVSPQPQAPRPAAIAPPRPVKNPLATISSPSLGPAVSSSTSPIPPVSTPAPTTTPQTASSPQTPKSPKVKPVNKPTRRPSKSQPAPEPEPSPANSLKRQREDEAQLANEPSGPDLTVAGPPSPKKMKTEWEGPTSDALIKKQQAIENIKTDDDACAFLEQLIRLSATNDTPDLAATLEMLLKGVTQDPNSDTSASLVSLSGGDSDTKASGSSQPQEEYFEFIDFSFSGPAEEDDSKAPTPDLVSSSSTNPSPESGGDSDPSSHSTSLDKIKIEDSGETSDPLHLGALKEIDGGESAYYQAPNWKWEGQMATLEQPWAIFPS